MHSLFIFSLVFTLGLESEHIPEKKKRIKKKGENEHQWIFSLFQCFILGLNLCGLSWFRTRTVTHRKETWPKRYFCQSSLVGLSEFLWSFKVCSPSLLSSLLAQKSKWVSLCCIGMLCWAWSLFFFLMLQYCFNFQVTWEEHHLGKVSYSYGLERVTSHVQAAYIEVN